MSKTQYRVIPETPKYQTIALNESVKQSLRAEPVGVFGRIGISAGLFIVLFIVIAVISFIVTGILRATDIITNPIISNAFLCLPSLIIPILIASFSYFVFEKTVISKKTKGEAEIIRRETELNNEARERELARVTAEAESLTLFLKGEYDAFLDVYALLSESLKEATYYLNKAEEEYKANAFAPFWEAVEEAAKWLGEFSEDSIIIATGVDTYYKKLQGKQHTFPVLPAQLQTIPDASPVIERFHSVVRMGQTNFHFANIWEHRKTRQITIAGFRTLNEAVYNLGDTIRDSVYSLQESFSSDVTRLVEEQIRTRESIVREQIKTRESIDNISNSLDETGASVDKRLLEQNRMLDNLQQDRKPKLKDTRSKS